jgi:hypothetical protein
MPVLFKLAIFAAVRSSLSMSAAVTGWGMTQPSRSVLLGTRTFTT